jgi:hypothetical protein
MTNLPIQYSNQYDELQEEVRSIISETHFKIESERLKGKWWVGKSIIDFAPHRKYGKAVIKKLSSDLGISERELYYCVKFAEKFPVFLDKHNEPEINSLEIEGKTPSWSRVKSELLSKESNCKHEVVTIKKIEIEVCVNCGKIIKRRESA